MKISKKLSLIVMVFTIMSSAQEEQKIDSLLNVIKTTTVDTTKASAYTKLSTLYRFKNPELTLSYSKKALSIYEDKKDFLGQTRTLNLISSYYNSTGKMDSAKYYVKKSIKTSYLTNNELSTAVQKGNLAYFELASGKSKTGMAIIDTLKPILKRLKAFDKIAFLHTVESQSYNMDGYPNLSLEATYKVLKIYEDLNDTKKIPGCYMLIGNIYQGEGDDEKSIEAFNEALKLYKKDDNKIFIAQALAYLGDSYINLKEFDKAEAHLNEALDQSEALNFNANIARSYLNLGRLKVAQKKYDKAIKHFTEGLESYKSINIPYNETRAEYHLGEAHYKKGNYSKAIEHLDLSISISERINDPARQRDALLLKSLAYEALGDSKNALTSLRANKKISDSLFNTENARKTEELQIQYETEKKEQQIVIQDNEIALLESKEKVSNLKIILLGSSLLFALMGLYAFFQRSKRHKLEKEKAESDLEFKTKELTTHALHLAKKNEVLNDLKQKAKVLKADANSDPGYQMLIQTINFDLQDDNNWENFSRYFEEVHKDFNSNAQKQFPNITSNDLRIMALIKMNLSSKEIANILNISSDGIKKARQRLRKKMGLDSKESLENTVMSI